ncbi:MAG: hypothetical protein ACO1OC_06065 [Tuberibacillus sp.]
MENRSRSFHLGIMGDPHRHCKETKELLQLTGFIDDDSGFQPKDQRVVCVGDYVDRGKEGIETHARG